jgi:S1-C subfamily serine protease
MTAIDWLIVALVLVLVPIGFRRGLMVAGLGLGGFAVGAAVGARLAPLLLEGGSSSPYAPGVALLGGVVLGGGVAIVLEGVAISLRGRLADDGPLARLDAICGGLVFAVLALAIAWVAGALALNAPALREVRDDVQGSLILGALNQAVPPSGPVLNVLNEIDPTPQIEGPSADVPAAPQGIVDDPEVQAASGSVVHVLGSACGLNVSGSGWVAAEDRVVTNAHVVAGEDDTTVTTRDGRELDAVPVAYRPRDDIAVLRVDGLGLPPLPIAPGADAGTVAAVLGFPGAGDFSAVPARLGTTGEVSSVDSYGNGPVKREMTSFRGDVISGNSGGPVVDGAGRVRTTVFAATVDSEHREGLGVPNDIVRDAVRSAGDDEVSTGACL